MLEQNHCFSSKQGQCWLRQSCRCDTEGGGGGPGFMVLNVQHNAGIKKSLNQKYAGPTVHIHTICYRWSKHIYLSLFLYFIFHFFLSRFCSTKYTVCLRGFSNLIYRVLFSPRQQFQFWPLRQLIWIRFLKFLKVT